jgi:hypothetical protein
MHYAIETTGVSIHIRTNGTLIYTETLMDVRVTKGACAWGFM